MPGLKIAPFGGMIPAMDEHLLPETNASYSRNTWLYSGSLRGINTSKYVRDVGLEVTKVYRIPNNYSEGSYIQDSLWLEFTDIDTDVVRNVVIGDTFDRYYWASPSQRPMYNTRARIAAGNTGANKPFLLGIPAPTVTPTLVVTGGSTPAVSRAYVYTFVSAYGEEGQPSVPVLANGAGDATWTITMGPADPNDLGIDRNLTHRRVYRTVTSQSGVTTYFLVTELPIATLVYADTLPDTTVVRGSELQSTNWNGPPADLAGMITLSNGMVAGFRENEVWFCEPYRMHAWPSIYTVVVEYPIVGLGVVNQGLVILTKGYPHIATGVNPASISLTKFAGLLPCTSRGSIISSPEGVFFTSQKGLELIGQGSVQTLTSEMIHKDDWQRLVAINTLRAARLGTGYYAFGSVRFGVFEPTAFQNDAFAQEDFTGGLMGALIDPFAKGVAFNTLSTDVAVTNVMTDVWSGEVFVIKDQKLYWLDIADQNVPPEPFVWKSKIYQTSTVGNLSAAKIFFSPMAATPPRPAVRNVDPVQTLAPDQYGLFKIYANGQHVLTREIWEDGELLRLPSGFKVDFWEFEFEGRVEVFNFQVGSSVKALANV